MPDKQRFVCCLGQTLLSASSSGMPDTYSRFHSSICLFSLDMGLISEPFVLVSPCITWIHWKFEYRFALTAADKIRCTNLLAAGTNTIPDWNRVMVCLAVGKKNANRRAPTRRGALMSMLRVVPFFVAIKILPGGCPPFLRIIRLEWFSSPLEGFPPFYAQFELNSTRKMAGGRPLAGGGRSVPRHAVLETGGKMGKESLILSSLLKIRLQLDSSQIILARD